jgi:hypothetical protein
LVDIYSVWSRAVQTGRIRYLDKVMNELYPNVTQRRIAALEALAIFVSTYLQQEETDYPAKTGGKQELL